MRLWVRLTLVMAVLAVTPLLTVGMLSLQSIRERAELEPEEAMAREATTLATFVGTWLDGQGDALEGWSRAWTLDADSIELQTQFLRAVYTGVRSVVCVAIVDRDNRPVVAPLYLEATDVWPGRVPSDPEHVASWLNVLPQLTTGETVAFGAPTEHRRANTVTIPVVVGPPDGALFLAAEIDLGGLAPVFSKGGGRQVGLLDRNGSRIHGTQTLVEPERISELLRMDEDSSFSPASDDLDGVRGAVSHVPDTDLVVLMAEPATLRASAMREIRIQTLLVGLLSLVVAFGLGVSVERGLSRPVNRLRDAVLAVANGDLGRKVVMQRNDELGELADAFDEMSTRLARNQHRIMNQQREIESFNQELQARVEDRTRELRSAQADLVRTRELAAVAEVGAGLAHELNNPLAAILGYAQLLAARGTTDTVLRHITSQAERCRDVVAQMLRLSDGTVDITRSPTVSISSLLMDWHPRLQEDLAARGVVLHMQAGGDVKAQIEPAMLEKIIVGLCEALGAGLPSGSSLTLSVEQTRTTGCVIFQPEGSLAGSESTADEWKAHASALWLARRLTMMNGGSLDEPGAGKAWRLCCPWDAHAGGADA